MVIDQLILPEILITSLACLILLWDVFIPQKYRITSYLFTQLGLLAVIISIVFNFKILNTQNFYLFKDSFVINPQINFFKLVINGFMLIIFMYAKDYIKSRHYFCGEYFVLSLLSMLGMMILGSSCHFLNFYLGIEMFSLPIYTLIALESKVVNLEAAIKYFVLSAIFSGILLYGLSLIYGASGSLDFQTISNFLESQHVTMLFKIGSLLTLIAIFFKLNLVPVHMWAPDLYQGASTPVTMLIASLPKITMVLVLSRIINEVFLKLFLFNEHWQILLIIVSVLSLLIGNVGAMLQTNIKRLLAYSAIGQAGFILLGFAANSIMGRIAANFYVVVYTLIIIGLLGIVTIFSKIDLEEIQDFRGLGKKHPWLGGVLLILLLSMVGIPPTIGFYSKFLIIKSLINANLIWVAIVALLLSVVSLFYCLRIIKIMYFIDDNQDHALNDLDYRNSKFRITTTVSTPLAIVLSINGILALGLGIFPVFINSILIYFG